MDGGTSSTSTGTQVKNFIENTPHVLEGRRLQTNSEYQRRLKYQANADFEGNELVMAGSVPNTFHHKKGSPARTKDLIGSALMEETSHVTTDEPPITTSTLRGKRLSLPDHTQQPPPQFNISDSVDLPENSNGGDKTADWMPDGLDEKWVTDDNVEGDDAREETPLDIPSGETMIRNSVEAEIPQWKVVQQEFQNGQKDRFNKFFEDAEPDELNLLTILGTNDNGNFGDQNNIGRGQYQFPPGTQLSPLKESPIKLFQDDYNTYTKNRMDGCIHKFKTKKLGESPQESNKAAPQAPGPIPAAPLDSKGSGPTLEKSSKQPADYMKDGNDLLRRIQGRGYQGNHNAYPSISNLMTTATLTPKPKRITADFGNDGDMLWTSLESFDNDDDINTLKKNNRDTMATMEMVNDMSHSRQDDEYTDIEPLPGRLQDEIIHEEQEDDDQYTNDSADYDQYLDSEIFEEIPASAPITASQPSAFKTPDTEDVDTNDQILKRLEILVTAIQAANFPALTDTIEKLAVQTQKAEASNGTEVLDNAEVLTEFPPATNFEEVSRIIQFKRKLQLSLRPQNNQGRELNLSKAHKERKIKNIPPGTYATSVGGMRFDSSRQLWIGAPEETVLDQIEDLQSDNEVVALMQPLAMRKLRRRAGNLEVLFVGALDEGDVLRVLNVLRVLSRFNPEVTRISQIGDTLYGQMRQALTSILGEVFADRNLSGDLQLIEEVDLASHRLESVKELKGFLPGLKKINLSKNRLVFLEGVNSGVKELDVLDNMLNNLTTFAHLTKLYRLNAARNQILGFSCLSTCDTLLILNISGNKITSLKGVERLVCLTELNCLHNSLTNEVDCSKLKLPNLIKLNLLNNEITLVTSINALPKLVVLNLNENKLTKITCETRHTNLKKLELKFNQMRILNLRPYPQLRILRIDGNALGVSDFHRLNNLEELLAKCQSSPNIVDLVVKGACDVRMLDLSGNQFFDIIYFSHKSFERGVQANLFKNLNKLVLVAMDLCKIPPLFSNMFPNVRLLNLNFNRLTDISGLSELQNLKKLYLVSNEIRRVKLVCNGLTGARNSLKVLDLRLNPCTVDMYPYVFSPEESKGNSNSSTTYIRLDRPDDIDTFVIHYDTINRNGEPEWNKRDAEYIKRLEANYTRRKKYELYMLEFFKQLRKFDGTTVSSTRRKDLMEEYQQNSIESSGSATIS